MVMNDHKVVIGRLQDLSMMTEDGNDENVSITQCNVARTQSILDLEVSDVHGQLEIEA